MQRTPPQGMPNFVKLSTEYFTLVPFSSLLAVSWSKERKKKLGVMSATVK
jgi:hypothetical protein